MGHPSRSAFFVEFSNGFARSVPHYLWRVCIISVTTAALATALRLWPLDALGVRNTWLTFYPSVMVAALYGGFWAGLLGSICSVLSVLFVLPAFVHRQLVSDPGGWIGLGVFFATSVMVAALGEAMWGAHEREQKAEEERNRFFSLSPELLCIAKSDGYFKRVNPAFAEALGWSEEELLARPFLDFVHPDDHAATLAEVEKQVTAGQKVLGFVNRYRHKDGSWRWLSWKSAGAPDGSMYAVARDITDGLRAEAAMRRLADIIETSDDAILSKDTNGIITSWNRGARRLFGYSADEIVGRPVTLLFPPDRIGEERFARECISRGERIEPFDTERVRKDGTLVDVSVTVSPLRDSSGRIIGASKIVRDITARKQAEACINGLNEDLERRAAQLAEANAELESFSYSVSHDLRAPLRHIHGYVEMLQRAASGQLSEKAQRYLTTIAEASTEMAQLIDDLLAFSRMTRAEMNAARVDLATLAGDAIRTLESANPGRDIDWRVEPLPPVVGDPAMLKQVFANLLDNAVKYTRQRDRARIEIGCAGEEDGRAVFFVRDNGAGFDMQYAHKLFGVFQRLHRADEYEGTGIGLAIVRRIVARHGGRVWADGAVDRGATVYFTLERSRAA